MTTRPSTVSRNEVAERLIKSHFAVDPGLTRIVRLYASAEAESQPVEPIKLLEVNENTMMEGIVPIYFGPHAASGTVFPSVIVEVAPEEFEKILTHEISLPNGWNLGEEYRRSQNTPKEIGTP